MGGDTLNDLRIIVDTKRDYDGELRIVVKLCIIDSDGNLRIFDEDEVGLGIFD